MLLFTKGRGERDTEACYERGIQRGALLLRPRHPQAVPLRAQRAALRQEQGGGRHEAGPLLHHRAHDLGGGVGRPDLARQLDQCHASECLKYMQAVLRIRDVYPGSEFFPIPDPNFFHPVSASKNFKCFNLNEWFLSSRKYDPGCSSRIRILTFFTYRGSRIQGFQPKGTK